MTIVDTWCNAFTPDRRPLWDAAIEAQGIPLKIRRDEEDGFAEPAAMAARMEALGVGALLLPTATVPDDAGPTEYEHFATHPSELARWRAAHPGRFFGLVTLDPRSGIDAVDRAAAALATPGHVGLHLHTHSWDRAFDHRDYYPFYALASDLRVPVIMQAGASGGLMPSQCGQPIGIDRPALYFGRTTFVLSHTGWPWVNEAVAMAQKHPNVYLGTAGLPPAHWPEELVRFLRGVGRRKTVFGTTFPVVGHRHALAQVPALELDDLTRAALLGDTARRIFTRLSDEGESS